MDSITSDPFELFKQLSEHKGALVCFSLFTQANFCSGEGGNKSVTSIS